MSTTTLTPAATALFEQLPEVFCLSESFDGRSLGATTILDEARRPLFVVGRSMRSFWSLEAAGLIVRVEQVSTADQGKNNLSVWMRA